jgi:hypothetical protein
MVETHNTLTELDLNYNVVGRETQNLLLQVVLRVVMQQYYI